MQNSRQKYLEKNKHRPVYEIELPYIFDINLEH